MFCFYRIIVAIDPPLIFSIERGFVSMGNFKKQHPEYFPKLTVIWIQSPLKSVMEVLSSVVFFNSLVKFFVQSGTKVHEQGQILQANMSFQLLWYQICLQSHLQEDTAKNRCCRSGFCFSSIACLCLFSKDNTSAFNLR